jgi:formylglycine-generating enzyme required for sulfatase activity
MKYKAIPILLFLSTLLASAYAQPFSAGKDLPKIAVWDLSPGDIKPAYAQDLTSILVSEVSKLKKYEVYSQENVRTLAGWTAERMTLGCTDTKCLTALGQMDIAKLISGRVGKMGNRYSVSLNLFDTQNVRAENSISEECKSEDELIPLVRQAVRKLLGIEVAASASTPPVTGRSFVDPVTGMEFVFIKGGCFEMGDTFGDGNSDEKPVHRVCLDDFYLGKFEVTQGQWEKVMGNNPSYFKGRDNPVEQVSWNDVQEYIDRLNRQSGRKYGLPTEAEWEYAARSGGKGDKFSGTSQESELGQYAWYSSNSGMQPHPVGQKKPNGLGLHDMSGNVWEWCADWYDENYYKDSLKNNPRGSSSGSVRVLRGGSWGLDPWYVRTANRDWGDPAYRNALLGFRLGLSAQ